MLYRSVMTYYVELSWHVV